MYKNKNIKITTHLVNTKSNDINSGVRRGGAQGARAPPKIFSKNFSKKILTRIPAYILHMISRLL